MRARRILVLVQKQDYQHRLRSFLESDDPAENFGLHGWTEFSALFGHDRVVREFFVSMQQSQAELFSAIPRGKNAVEEKLRAACVLTLNEQSPSQPQLLEAVATILLMVSMEFPQLPSDTKESAELTSENHRDLASALASPQIEARLKNGQLIGGFKSLMVQWLSRLSNDDSEFIRCKVIVADRYLLPEMVPSAALAMKDIRMASNVRAQAILVVARLGGPEQNSDLESLLSDATQVYQDRRQSAEVQIRDLALAALIFIAKQGFADFGFEFHDGPDDRFPNVEKAGFRTEERRLAAIQKWSQIHQQHIKQDR
jgi:hypothetical protein